MKEDEQREGDASKQLQPTSSVNQGGDHSTTRNISARCDERDSPDDPERDFKEELKISVDGEVVIFDLLRTAVTAAHAGTTVTGASEIRAAR